MSDESRTPPHDLSAEAAVISAVIIDTAALPKVSDLRPEHFYSEAHRWMYEAAVELGASGKPIDVVTVATWLRDHERLAQVGGMAYLTEVLNAAPAVANIRAYADTVRTKAHRRAAITAAQRITAEGYAGGDADADFLSRSRQLMDDATRLADGATLSSNAETLAEIVKGIQRASQTGSMVTGIPTGIDAYDRLTLGLHAKRLTIVGARPGVGKTALGGTVGVNVARKGVGVLFVSLEMGREEIIERALSGLARIDATVLKLGRLSPVQWSSLFDAAKILSEIPFWVDDRTGVTVHDIRARAIGAIEQAMRMGTALGLIIVDYLQKVAVPLADRKKSRYEQVGDVAKGMKQLSRETGLPVICLAQLKRVEKTKERKAPSMDDLRESGDIEQEADNVTLIHAPEEETRELMIDKARGGRRGLVKVAWKSELTLFENMREDPGGYQEERYP